MQQKFSYLLRIIFVPLLLSLALAACGGEDEDNDNGGDLEAVGGRNRQAVPAATTDDAADSAADDAGLALAEAGGALLFIQGESLYHLPLGEGAAEPVLLVEDINTDLLSFSPDRRHLLYSPRTASMGQLRMLSVDNLEGQALRELRRGRDWRVQGWSRDGQWAVVRVSGERAELIDTATGELHLVEVNFDFFQPTWLQDGRILFAEQEFGGNGETLRSVQLYDPAAREWQSFEEGEAGLPLTATAGEGPPQSPLGTFMEEQGLESIPRDFPAYWYQPPEDFFRDGAALCDTWSIIHVAGEREAIYTVEDAFKFSEIQQPAEDTLLFLEWQLPDCRPGSAAEVSLVRLSTAGAAQPLVEDIFPGIDTYVSQNPEGTFGGPDMPRYQLSPDGQFVAWVSGSLAERQSSLSVMDLASEAEAQLLAAPSSATDAAFIQQNVIRALYWLAP